MVTEGKGAEPPLIPQTHSITKTEEPIKNQPVIVTTNTVNTQQKQIIGGNCQGGYHSPVVGGSYWRKLGLR